MPDMGAPDAGSRTVLLATGDNGVRERFADPLQQAGHRTLEATRISALLASLETAPAGVDLLLLDLRLAGSDGVALFRRVRALAARLPVMVFSGSVTNAGEVRELAALGITGYVNEHCDTPGVLPSLAPHLFPDSFNRRSSPRVVLAIPVSYRVDSTIAAAVTLNIGPGGLAIRTMSPLGVSAKVRTRFRLPGSPLELDAESRVAWSDPRVGMGLQFEQVDASDQTAMDEYVDRQLAQLAKTSKPAGVSGV